MFVENAKQAMRPGTGGLDIKFVKQCVVKARSRGRRRDPVGKGQPLGHLPQPVGIGNRIPLPGRVIFVGQIGQDRLGIAQHQPPVFEDR